MLVLVVIVAALAAIAVLVVLAARRGDALGEVERFHRARAMTTSWSHQGAPPVAEPQPETGRERSSAT